MSDTLIHVLLLAVGSAAQVAQKAGWTEEGFASLAAWVFRQEVQRQQAQRDFRKSAASWLRRQS